MLRRTREMEVTMLMERISEEIYVFTSDLYAQVTAGVIVTSEGAVVVDTLPFPQETRELLFFVQERGLRVPFVINTHSHADHVNGSYLFEEADLVAHRRCRAILRRHGQRVLEEAKAETPELAEVQLRLPSITFDQELTLRLGDRTMRLIHLPGHTPDLIGVYVEEDKILFAGDAVMPVPYIVGGDREAMIDSLRAIGQLSLENIVQGHGEVVLRGEVEQALESSIFYLETIYEKVKEAVEAGAPPESVAEIDIEQCGKSRIPLNGLVQQLHEANLLHLYELMTAQVREGAKMII
jgi:glyoxylase-like metal-dependent hydrolase (beta-lactamase superfamily II)